MQRATSDGAMHKCAHICCRMIHKQPEDDDEWHGHRCGSGHGEMFVGTQPGPELVADAETGHERQQFTHHADG